MNEKRAPSPLEKNLVKKKKLNTIVMESSPTDFYQQLEIEFKNLQGNLTTAKQEQLSDNNIRPFFVKIVENRCVIGDAVKDHDPISAIQYYQTALQVYEEWNSYGTSNSKQNAIGDKFKEEDIKQLAVIYYNLYALQSNGEYESLVAAQTMLEKSIFYYECLEQQKTTRKDIYKKELEECKQELTIIQSQIQTLKTQIEAPTEAVAATHGVSTSNYLFKFNDASYVLDEIKNAGQDKIIIRIKNNDQQVKIVRWLNKTKTLNHVGKLKMNVTHEGIFVEDPKIIFRLKQWQEMVCSINQSFNLKNWKQIFDTINNFKISEKKNLFVNKRLSLLEIYHKKIGTFIPEQYKIEFENSYQAAHNELTSIIEKAKQRAEKSKQSKLEKKAAKELQKKADESITLPPIIYKDIIQDSSPLNKHTSFEIQSSASPSFFNHNYSTSVRQENPNNSRVPHLAETPTLPAIFHTTIPSHDKIFNPQNLPAVSFFNKEVLEGESLESLRKRKQEMISVLYPKRLDEAKKMLVEIRGIENELGIQRDPSLTLEGNLSYEVLKQKTVSLKNKLDELKVQLKNKLIQDIFELDKEFAPSSNEQTRLSFGK